MLLRLAILCVLPLTVLAGLPLPDHILYGTIAIENQPVTRQRTDVVVEARREANGPVLASYRMGSTARLGEFYYELRVQLEEAPVTTARTAVPGETLFITVRDANGVQHEIRQLVSEPGIAFRLDFGASVDTTGDGVPDGWELAMLGRLNGDLSLDTDGDGAVDRDEYAAGTRPADATDVFRLSVHSVEEKVQVSFRALKAAGLGFDGRQRFYALESTTNLVNGPWQPVDNHSRIPGSNQLVTFLQPALGTNPPPFFRARVWLEGP